jgi:hypothetical protein
LGRPRDTRILATALKRVERPAEMVLGVESLERRQRATRERLEMLLVATKAGPSETVDSDPLGPEYRPLARYLQTRPKSSNGYG